MCMGAHVCIADLDGVRLARVVGDHLSEAQAQGERPVSQEALEEDLLMIVVVVPGA